MLSLAARIINCHNCVFSRREYAAEESHASKEREERKERKEIFCRSEHKMAEMVTTKPAHCEVTNVIVL